MKLKEFCEVIKEMKYKGKKCYIYFDIFIIKDKSYEKISRYCDHIINDEKSAYSELEILYLSNIYEDCDRVHFELVVR